MKRFVIIGLLVVVFGGILLIVLQPRARSVVRVNEADPKLQRAISEARSHLPEFWSKVRQAPEDRQRDFAVKVRFRTEQGAEFLWVRGPLRRAAKVTGTLDQRPMVLPVQKGEPVEFREGDIVDWMIRNDDGTLEGGQTEKVLAGR